MTEIHNESQEHEDFDNIQFDTILSEDIEFSGTLIFERPFMIRGKLSGDIFAKGLLVVDENAVVEANIQAPRVIIRGSVKGDVTAVSKVEITVTGKLQGDVTAPEIFMETGCVFNGRCTMTGKGGE